MQKQTFIEVGHFYADEFNHSIDISYLETIVSKLISFKSTVFALFIDNYNSSAFNLNVTDLKTHYESVLSSPVHVFYEGDMERFYHQTLTLFSDKDLVITKYNRGKKQKLELALGDSRITLAEIEPTFKITCAMLSLMWTLYRLGVYDGNEISNVVTVIDEKYMKVEEKVITMLKYIQENRNHDYISSVDYWFYQT